ncbi:metallophosphoesterase [Kitasatospora sp. NPDC092286]|uniref:metallophosphoesterase n=1 Tax=Kitasatospora sp. NPDC092286 TaxID=3364087 RepID=UPI0037F1A1AA
MNHGQLPGISDLHVAYPENRDIVEKLRPESDRDWLLVAGDGASWSPISSGRRASREWKRPRRPRTVPRRILPAPSARPAKASAAPTTRQLSQ